MHQITERGYSVAKVSDRLGVSAHSLYKWLRAIKPDNSEQHARDLLEAKKRDPEATSSVETHRRRARYSDKGRSVLCKGA
ncbi:TPA: transposase [Aeromonas hydrophila]|nr:transposase [Aeromonas hydrophila]